MMMTWLSLAFAVAGLFGLYVLLRPVPESKVSADAQQARVQPLPHKKGPLATEVAHKKPAARNSAG